MIEFLRRILFLVLAAAVVYGGYVAYKRWWSSGTAFDIGGVRELGTDLQNTAETYVKESVDTAKTAVQKKAQETIEDYTKKAVVSAVSFVGDTLESFADSIIGTSTKKRVFSPLVPVGATSSTAPMPASPSFALPPPPATFVTQVGVPLVFSINKRVSYTVEWGDRVQEKGEVTNDVVKLLSHTWHEEGDYVVTITVKDTAGTKLYSFPVRVY